MKIMPVRQNKLIDSKAAHIPVRGKKYLQANATGIRNEISLHGNLLTEEMILEDVHLQVFHFTTRDASCRYKACFEKPVIVLQFMKEGHWISFSGNTRRIFSKDSFRLAYKPADLLLEVPKGTTAIIQFELPVKLFDDVAEDEKNISMLLEKLRSGCTEFFYLNEVSCFPEINVSLNKIFNNKEKDASLVTDINVMLRSIINAYRKALRPLFINTAITPDKKIEELYENIKREPHLKKYAMHRVIKEQRIDKATLQKTFMEKWGISYNRFLIGECMELAIVLLAENQSTIEQIAARAGYGDKSNFTKALKRYKGKTPSEMRK